MDRNFRGNWLSESYPYILAELRTAYRILRNPLVKAFQLRRREDHVTMRDHNR